MTFSSLHSGALPLYAGFGVDAWWPLLYLHGPVGAVAVPAGWATVPPARPSSPGWNWPGPARTGRRIIPPGRGGRTDVTSRQDNQPARYLSHPVVSPAAVDRMNAMMSVLRRAGPSEESARSAYGLLHSGEDFTGLLAAVTGR